LAGKVAQAAASEPEPAESGGGRPGHPAEGPPPQNGDIAEPLDPPPAGGSGRGRLPPPPPGRGGRLSASAEYPDDFRSARDAELEQIIDDLTGDRPENQTVEDMPPGERHEICNDIETFTKDEEWERRESELPYNEREIPPEILARHGVGYSVRVVRYFESLDEGAQLPTHVIDTFQRNTSSVDERKIVHFFRDPDDPGASVEADQESVVENVGASTVPGRPLTLKQITQIHQALRDALREER
jgi:hypothetical protein